MADIAVSEDILEGEDGGEECGRCAECARRHMQIRRDLRHEPRQQVSVDAMRKGAQRQHKQLRHPEIPGVSIGHRHVPCTHVSD